MTAFCIFVMYLCAGILAGFLIGSAILSRFCLLAVGLSCLAFAGCDVAALASPQRENFTAKWSAIAAAHQTATDVTPVKPITPGVCSNCNGKGKVGDGVVMVTCAVCGGDGRIEGVSANPLCKCEKCKCECDPCKCPLQVSSPTDSLSSKSAQMPGVIVPVKHEPVPQVCPVVPAPKPQVCPTLPKQAAAPVATGKWVTRHYGRRGQFQEQVWVPTPKVAAKAPSAQPVYQSFGCGPGGCSSCGRGRR